MHRNITHRERERERVTKGSSIHVYGSRMLNTRNYKSYDNKLQNYESKRKEWTDMHGVSLPTTCNTICEDSP